MQRILWSGAPMHLDASQFRHGLTVRHSRAPLWRTNHTAGIDDWSIKCARNEQVRTPHAGARPSLMTRLLHTISTDMYLDVTAPTSMGMGEYTCFHGALSHYGHVHVPSSFILTADESCHEWIPLCWNIRIENSAQLASRVRRAAGTARLSE